MRKFLLRSAIVLAVLAALGGIALLIERNSAKAAWETYAAAARARGVKLSLKDEMLQPPIPDAENFAAVPIFAQLFESAAGGGTESELFDLPLLSVELRIDTPLDLEAWRSRFVEEKWLAADAPDATPAAVLRVLDERFGTEWEQLREAAARPQCRFPVQWEKNFAVEFPHFSPLQRALKICALRADAHIAQGDGAAANDDLHLLLRLHSALEKEPVLICWLVRNSMLWLAKERVRKGLAARVWDDATLLRIDAELARIKPLAGYQWATESERGMLNDCYALAQAGDPASLNAMLASLTGGGGLSLLPATLTKSWLSRNQLRCNQHVDERLARIDASGERYIPTPPGRSVLNPAPGRLERLNYALFYSGIEVFSSMEQIPLRAHTLVQCARTAVALERWRLAKGTYPESLAALVPGLLPAVPHDVIDGQPLRYRRTEEGGYLLYSLGLDAKDDGGTGPKPRTSDKDAPDWVWKP